MAKPVHWSPHALKRLGGRRVNVDEITHTMESPQWVMETSPAGRRIFMRKVWDDALQKELLLRVVFDETIKARVIVTVYYTSKFTKYLPAGE